MGLEKKEGKKEGRKGERHTPKVVWWILVYVGYVEDIKTHFYSVAKVDSFKVLSTPEV